MNIDFARSKAPWQREASRGEPEARLLDEETGEDQRCHNVVGSLEACGAVCLSLVDILSKLDVKLTLILCRAEGLPTCLPSVPTTTDQQGWNTGEAPAPAGNAVTRIQNCSLLVVIEVVSVVRARLSVNTADVVVDLVVVRHRSQRER